MGLINIFNNIRILFRSTNMIKRRLNFLFFLSADIMIIAFMISNCFISSSCVAVDHQNNSSLVESFNQNTTMLSTTPVSTTPEIDVCSQLMNGNATCVDCLKNKDCFFVIQIILVKNWLLMEYFQKAVVLPMQDGFLVD